MKDTKTRILEAAVELFTEVGYSRTTTRVIAEHAGVNESTFFRIYKSKGRLLSDMIYFMTSGPEDLDISELTGGEDLEKDIGIFLYDNAILHIGHMPIFRLSMHVDEIYNQQRFSKIEGLVAKFADYLEELYEKGLIRKMDFMALSEFVNSLAIVRATEFIIGETYEIPSEQSALDFSKQYASFFAKLLRNDTDPDSK